MPTSNNQKKNIPLISWVISAIGLLLLLSVIVFLLAKAFVGGTDIPKIHIQASSVFQDSGKYLVILEVTNHGELTVATLLVEGILMNGKQTVEKSTATLDYVPSGSTRKAGIYFINDPENFELILRPVSYEQP